MTTRRLFLLSLLGAFASFSGNASFAENASTNAHASETPAPEQFGALQWRSIGPFRGGRVVAVAGVVGEREHFYFGAVNGGVWETTDAGRTWAARFDAQSTTSIGAIAIAPSNSRVIYVGTGEADMRSDIAQGDGMYKSIDGGQSWTSIGLSDSQQIARIKIDPKDANRVYVAALGHPYGPNAERGVFRSTDGGGHWQKVLGPNADVGAVDLTFDPSDARVLYAALWQTRRTPWSVYPPSNGPGSGVYKSTDGGDHWQKIGDGLPAHHGRVGFAISAAAPQRVYATVDAEPGGGLYRSDDAGAHWKLMSGDNRIWQRGWYFGELGVDPKNADRIWALNTIILRSEDGGAHFAVQKGDATGDDFHAMWIDPNDSKRQILGVDQGAIVTLNGGETWSSWYNQPTGQFYHVATDNRFPYFVYGAQQDSGAAGVPSRTTHGDGINMMQFRELTAGGESDNIAPDPNDPDIIYGGRVARLDLRSKQTRNIDPTLAYPDQYRRTWTLPLTFSVRDSKVLYFANQKLFRSDNGGVHWDIISPDLTRPDPGTPKNLDETTAALNLQMGPRRGVIYAIAPSKVADHDVWVGTDDGRVWRTRDEGVTWLDVTPKGANADDIVTGWAKIAMIDTSAQDAEVATIAVDRHRLDDFKPYIYRTQDGGKSWRLIVNGIAERHFVNSVREDPKQANLLYAGTERGVYVSFNGGVQWQALQNALPPTSVRDLVIKDNDLVIATHGRGFWILDDVSALRELATDPERRTRLYAPASAMRLRSEEFSGTPMPKDEPMAVNPSTGAALDYYLNATAKEPLTLTIRAADGTLVRSYTSTDTPAKADASSATSALEWQPKPSTLDNSPGMHRFIWPIQYAAPAELSEGNAFAEGVWAPPGSYSVELNVDGVKLRQTLSVTADPRIQISAADYAAQFELAKQIEVLRANLAVAAKPVYALQKALSERLNTNAATDSAAKTRKLLTEFQAKLTALTGSVPTSNPSNSWWLPPKSMQSLRFAENVLNALDSAVAGADAAPTEDAKLGLTQARAKLPGLLKACNDFITLNLEALNQALVASGQLPLPVAATGG